MNCLNIAKRIMFAPGACCYLAELPAKTPQSSLMSHSGLFFSICMCIPTCGRVRT